MATKKINREANPKDLEQMKNMFASTDSVKHVQQDTQISQDNSSNLSNSSNFSTSENIKTENSAENKQIQTVAAENTSKIITEENKPVSDTTVGIRMTTAKKREMKSYFIQHGTTMSQGVLDAFSLLKTLEAEGLISYKDGLLERT